jgi:hypothetical protein
VSELTATQPVMARAAATTSSPRSLFMEPGPPMVGDDPVTRLPLVKFRPLPVWKGDHERTLLLASVRQCH